MCNLNIGPDIQNLEFFEKLENLYLNFNCIESIGDISFQFNIHLQILNLSNNQISRIEGISHLRELSYLNLSSNKIQEFQPSIELPVNISMLHMNQNPVEMEDPDYRKRIVCALEYLTELDKIKVVAAERMTYRGLLPHSSLAKVQANLEKFKRERQEKDARDKMEMDLFIEMMEE